MMKFTLATLAALFVAASAIPEISVNSKQGQALLAKSRRVEEEYDWETQYAWMTGYAVKYQGCHQIKQWNDNADGDEDVKIETKRLVRFRLCPEDSCSASKAAGCTNSYGDYIADMDTFMQSYIQGKQQQQEHNCEYHLAYSCDCNDDDAKGDDFNADYCEYDCFNNAGMTECIERNPYAEDGAEEQEQFDIEQFMECAQIEPANGNDDAARRRLDEEEVQYFVGPYCSEQGGAIKLGLFTDDTCTTAASGVTFKDLMGYTLPYSGEDENIIDMQCLSCMEPQEVEQNNNGNDAEDADAVNEMCEALYTYSGKCEANYPSGMLYKTNMNACTYMEGIRIVRQDGIIDTGSSRPSAVATAFIVIFAMAFAAMAFYVWYLRTRLGVKKNTLL